MRDALRHNGAVTAVAVAPAAPVTAVEPAEDDDESNGGKVRNDDEKFGGQERQNLVGNQRENSLPTKKRQRSEKPLPTKVDERRGWIEFPKKGTKNPKRYAQRRRWIKVDGVWKKSRPKRLKSIPPMTEVDYVEYKKRQERAKRAARRQRRGVD